MDREYAKPSKLPDWMKEFAEKNIKREAEGKNPFDEIRSLFQINNGMSEVEKKVSELAERIGLNKLKEKESIISNASFGDVGTKIELIKSLASYSNTLDKRNDSKYKKIDRIIAKLVKSIYVKAEDVPQALKEFPSLKIFIDNVCASRAGNVSVYAIIKMIRDERKEDVNVTDDLVDYINSKIEESKKKNDFFQNDDLYKEC